MNCENHCNAKCKMLGGLEQKIMNVLWAATTALKPSDVLKNMSGKHAYTTITTVLKRMVNKKLVTRKSVKNIFYYKAAIDKATYAADCLDDLFYRLFDTYGSSVSESYQKISRKFKY